MTSNKIDKEPFDIIKSFIPTIAVVGVTSVLLESMTRGMRKMFEETAMPKDLAKQLMEGMVKGMLDHFEGKIATMANTIDELEEKNCDLQNQCDCLKRDLVRKEEELAKLKNKDKKVKK
jgi:hypothetical protein